MNYNLSFQELAKLQMEILSNSPSLTSEEKKAQIQSIEEQSSFTLEEMRAQAMSVKIQSSAGHVEQEIKKTLRIYYSDWTEGQIETEYQRLVKAYSK